MVQKETISILIPVFNEEKSIAATVDSVKKTLAKHPHEIICIKDGSSDNTLEILKKIPEIVLISNTYNLGYGASLKKGIRAAKGNWIAITDADSTYPIDRLEEMIQHMDTYDMIVGARSGKNVPLMRRPAKAILTLLANILTGRKIPDLNSGFRLFKKDVAMEFMHLYPSGFSFTTTITLACLTNDYTVKYIPVEYYKREGKSTIKPIRDFVGFLTLIFRIMMYFEPLKFFLAPSIVLILYGLGKAIYEHFAIGAVSAIPVVFLLAGLQIGFLGLLADLIVKKRR